MIKSWKRHGPEYYEPIQKEILDCASTMLKSQGKTLYSTCTFSPQEDESVVKKFIADHPIFSLQKTEMRYGFSEGKPQWAQGDADLKNCVRLWPHKLEGEGHFLTLMKKESMQEVLLSSESIEMRGSSFKVFDEFAKENLNIDIQGNFQVFNENLYLAPPSFPSFKGLRVLRTGWFLGTIEKDRFRPSHALAMGLSYGDAKRSICFHRNDKELIKYLKGETLNIGGEKGWTLICVDYFPLGWAKQTGDMLKNYYPPAWRWL